MKTQLLSGGLLCTTALFAQNQPPNILWIVADDMRASTIECLGEEEVKTPVLNQLAGESTLFTNAHIMGGTSGAVSMPSRAMLMTGKYLHALERQGAVLPPSHTTVGEVLREAGYQTFHTGKWHNDFAAFNRTFDSGEAIFFGGMADHWNVPLFHYHADGQYKSSRRVIREPGRNNHTEVLSGEYAYSGKHSVDIFTDTAIDFLNNRQEGDKPFFLSLCYMSPHDPRSMPDEFLEMYDPASVTLPANYVTEHPFDNGELKIRDEVLAAIPRQEAEVKKHIADYYAMISHLDARIGHVIQALKDNGLYENTIVVFLADNGLAVGQHGLMGKQNLYRHSVNVPLMIKRAGQTVPVVTDKMCYLIDLYPTMCVLAGISVPQSVDGVSLLPVLERDEVVRPYLYLGYRHLHRAVTDGEWKLIDYRVNGAQTSQLFHLKNDPMETNNLYDEKKQVKVIKRLRSQMDKLRVETKDQSEFWE
ncbi:MAG: sulfatase-like hydrolase/transferase [Tannerellaceae bacterium]|nr:sulfatase-like hydrolase/transferase [Tannerellaceae bacterium]